MFSQCPSCKARFRVTAATLRAAHGRARCGHCGHQFDALEHLFDEMPPGGERARSTAPAEKSTKPAKPEKSGKDTKPPFAGAAPPDAAATPPSPVAAPPAPAVTTPTPAASSLADAEADLISLADAELTSMDQEPGPEDYHFSAEDIEKVFIDARDWQKQYGGGPTAGSDEPAAEVEAEPAEFELEEAERVEDITLEGRKADIESDNGESMHLEAEFEYLEEEDIDDLDSTSRLRTLDDVPESAYPEDEEEESPAGREPIAKRQQPPGAVATPARSASPDDPARTATAKSASAAIAPAAATGATRPGDVPMRAGLRASPAERWIEARRQHEPGDDLSEFDLGRAAGPRAGRSGRLLALGSLLLALALGVQLAHYFRQDIVRHPQAGPVLRGAYAMLGQPLSPTWDLDAFEVRQWGPTVDVAPSAPLTVRASLTNRATHAQPYPLLRLEFEDRFGEAVAQRDFAPAEYLKSPPQAARQLSAGQSTEAELSVIAPGADAVGYRLDVCLREEAGPVRCAHGES
jgi:predicted Zn finger-like uncharacterized protein